MRWLPAVILLLAFSASVSISRETFDRPLFGNHESAVAHTLVGMRAFDDWGFWRLGGILFSVPRSKEIVGSFDKLPERGYFVDVSYPPFWLWLPYGVLQILRRVAGVQLSVPFVETYGLLVNRLGVALAIFFLGRWIMRRLTGKSLHVEAGALLLSVTWLFQPGALYWTQHAYFADTAVLLPLYLLSLLTLRNAETPKARPFSDRAALFLVTLWACGTDWSAWIVATVGAAILVHASLSTARGPRSARWKKAFARAAPIGAGIASVSIVYCFQLLWLGNRFAGLWSKFLTRAGGTSDQLVQIPAVEILKGITGHWSYLTTPVSIVTSNPGGLILAFVCVSMATLPFFLGWRRKMEGGRTVLYGWLILVLCPLLHLLVLKQHAYGHRFSAHKIALLSALAWLALPLVFLRGADTRRSRLALTGFLIASIAVAGFCFQEARTRYREVAGPTTSGARELAEGLNSFAGKGDVLVSSDILAAPLEQTWYLNRLIYTPRNLRLFSLEGIIDVTGMNLIQVSISKDKRMSCPHRSMWLPKRAYGGYIFLCAGPGP